MNTDPPTLPGTDSVDEATMRSWTDAGEPPIVLDVRSGAEFEALHIRGSHNVPLPLLSEHADDLAERLDRRAVLVCQSGARAEQARHRLNAAGVTAAHVLTGGIAAYTGADVVRGARRWDLERQVRLVAGSLVVAGLAGGRFLTPRLRVLAGGVGAGLTFSAMTNTCAMGRALSAMPWNRATKEPTRATAFARLATRPPTRVSG